MVTYSDRADFRRVLTQPVRLQWRKVELDRPRMTEVLGFLRRGKFQSADPTLLGPAYLPNPLPPVEQMVAWPQGRSAPAVMLSLGEEYDLERVTQKARRARDPYLSPHGAFVRLKYRDQGSALGFMREFGPLRWTRQGSTAADWVYLDDFWGRQARFVAIAMLWEGLRRGREALHESWAWVHKHYDQTKIPGESGLGGITSVSLPAEIGKSEVTFDVPMPWQTSEEMLPLLKLSAGAKGDHWSALRLNSPRAK